ncbi:hypothetical protein NOVOSPHI9U_70093 [Novosphingobium sp. 9U]|nr:hypothetical protein NOVOSPHI9U_70093 [Novosphingobium sp. 9U]
MTGQARHQRRAAEHRQRHQVERHCRPIAHRRFDAGAIAVEEPKGAPSGLVPALAAHAGEHRRVNRMTDPLAIERTEQVAGVGVAEPGLVAGIAIEAAHCVLSDATRAIAAAGEPYRVERGVVRALDQGIQPLRVAPGEVTVDGKALWVDVEFDIRELGGGESMHAICVLRQDRCGWGANGDADHVRDQSTGRA